MQFQVTDNAAATRFEITLNDVPAGHLDYLVTDGVYTLRHTWTDPRQRGNGVATHLVRWALEEIDARGGSVIPSCSFVQSVIEQHPEYEKLVDGATPAAYCTWRPPA